LTGRFLSVGGLACRFFFFSLSLSGHFSSAGRTQNFFWTLLHSIVSPRARIFYLVAVRSHPAARTEPFFCDVRSAAAVHAEFFFLSVRSLLHSPSGRHAADFFFLLLTAMHACQGRQRFFFCPVASGQQQLRAQFFLSQPHSTAVCAAFCSCDRSLCHPRSKETIFLSLPCSSVRDTGRAELFFCAFLFLLPSGLICADTWF
jgi:hypothetical protein